MSMIEIKNNISGVVGWLHEIEPTSNDSLLVFQLPRRTKDISETYIEAARSALRTAFESNKNVLLIGCDVNIYEIAGADAVMLKLQGKI